MGGVKAGRYFLFDAHSSLIPTKPGDIMMETSRLAIATGRLTTPNHQIPKSLTGKVLRKIQQSAL